MPYLRSRNKKVLKKIIFYGNLTYLIFPMIFKDD